MTEKGRRTHTCDAPEMKGCEFAKDAAKEAVERTFAIMGIDVNDPKQVSNFQDDLRFNSKFRRWADKGPVVAFLAGIGVAILAFVFSVKINIFGG